MNVIHPRRQPIVDSLDWQTLLRVHGPTVYRAAWRIVGCAADAEDIVQEVFLEAYRGKKYSQARNLPGLLRKMATCRAVDLLRAKKQFVPVDLQPMALDADPQMLAIKQELGERLRQALTELPQQQAAVFCLRFFEEMSYQEIAQSLGITIGAAGVALHKARQKLSELLGALVGEARE